MKTAIYVRVSTDKQETDNQELQLLEYVKNNKWTTFKIYKDVISGKETKRKAFDELFLDSHKKLFDVVLFWDLSRFSRAGTYHTLMKLKELDNLGIKWVSYNEHYINSLGDFKDVIISIMATLAKIEREKISERTKAGLERAKKQGKKLGKRKTILTDFEKQLILKEYKQQGSIKKTAKVLSGRWSYGFIYNFIKNENK